MNLFKDKELIQRVNYLSEVLDIYKGWIKDLEYQIKELNEKVESWPKPPRKPGWPKGQPRIKKEVWPQKPKA